MSGMWSPRDPDRSYGQRVKQANQFARGLRALLLDEAVWRSGAASKRRIQYSTCQCRHARDMYVADVRVRRPRFLGLAFVCWSAA